MRKISKAITDRNNILLLLIFIFIFSIGTLIIYTPFTNNQSAWFPLKSEGALYYTYTILPAICGIVILAISKYLLYLYHRKREISYGLFGFWIIIEILIISSIYTTIDKFAFGDQRSTLEIFIESTFYIAIMIIIPYIISILFILLHDKKKIIKKLEKQVSSNAKSETITFTDDRKNNRFTTKLENICYVKSAGNYVIIYYKQKDKIEEFLLKNSINNIEAEFKEKGLFRCHRSYIVNVFKIVTIKKKNAKEIYVELDDENCELIPMSKSYKSSVSDFFNKKSEEKLDE